MFCFLIYKKKQTFFIIRSYFIILFSLVYECIIYDIMIINDGCIILMHTFLHARHAWLCNLFYLHVYFRIANF